MTSFFFTHAQAVLTGVLRLGYEYFSIDEAFFLYIGVLLMEAVKPMLLVNVMAPEGTVVLGVDISGFRLVWAMGAVFLLIPTLVMGSELLTVIFKKKLGLVSGVGVFLSQATVIACASFLGGPPDVYWIMLWLPCFGLCVIDKVCIKMKESTGLIKWYVAVALCSLSSVVLPKVEAIENPRAWTAALAWFLYLAAMYSITIIMKKRHSIPTLITVPAANQKIGRNAKIP